MSGKRGNDEIRVFWARDRLKKEQPGFEMTYKLFLASYHEYLDALGRRTKDQPKATSSGRFVTE